MSLIPADIAPDVIRKGLRARRIGQTLRVLAEVGSTNDVALEAGRRGEPEGLTVLADHQTAGRGRRGRRWASPPGVGLYMSVLLRPEQPPRRAPLLGLAAGLAVAEAIEELAGLTPRLKWPNDVVHGGRKVAGILPELETDGDTVSHVVLGIGLNLNQCAADFPPEAREAATSLRMESGGTCDRGLAGAAVLNALDRWYPRFCAAEFGAILAAYRGRSATLGQRVDVLSEATSWQGEALDLDPDGALLVRDAAGTLRRVLAADVSIRERPGPAPAPRATR